MRKHLKNIRNKDDKKLYNYITKHVTVGQNGIGNPKYKICNTFLRGMTGIISGMRSHEDFIFSEGT